jgi:hypothetical protein
MRCGWLLITDRELANSRPTMPPISRIGMNIAKSDRPMAMTAADFAGALQCR